ncbi:MAG: hypothetical protein ACRD44_09700 [Bryobacteraceae bacterium]
MMWFIAMLLAQELSPDLLLLARIKVVMEQNLNSLPNYTCTQTVERSQRAAPTRRFRLVDTLRLEVALINGKELFSWPGAKRFEERRLSEIVGGGTTADGSFGLHARAVFLGRSATFTYAGPREREGRQTQRFDYQVPQMLSGYQIKVAGRQAIVGYHGSFWVDAQTLDLIRLEVRADDIPPDLGLSSAGDAMEYARVKIGEGESLLPQISEVTMIDLAGGEYVNRTQFSGCRQYAGESVISFDAPPEETAETPRAETTAPLGLPSDLTLDLELMTPIRFQKAAVGDPLSFRLTHDVKRKGELLLGKGATVDGRVTRLERSSGRWELRMVGVQLHSITDGGRSGEIRASLSGVAALTGSASVVPYAGWREARRYEESGNGIFFTRGNWVEVPRGFRMRWRTATAPAEGSQSNGEKK